jgi:hypothetical protein
MTSTPHWWTSTVYFPLPNNQQGHSTGAESLSPASMAPGNTRASKNQVKTQNNSPAQSTNNAPIENLGIFGMLFSIISAIISAVFGFFSSLFSFVLGFFSPSVLHYYATRLINVTNNFAYQQLQRFISYFLSPNPPKPGFLLHNKRIAVIGAGLTGVSSAVRSN